MSTLAEPLAGIKKPWQWIAAGAVILLIWSAIALPNLNRTRTLPAFDRPLQSEPSASSYAGLPAKAKAFGLAEQLNAPRALALDKTSSADGGNGRKIIRTSSMEMVVQHPAETADKITALAEGLGGYLVSSDGGGQSATAGTVTIRVPASRFEDARAEIRKLGLRVESEKIDAQDVSRQFVDQDASLRNLRAEESQYLAILKRANTVKEMLAATEPLSEVRGQIEQQQAEFNALSRQIETVALTISLRTDAEAKVFGLNWRPVYQLKLALRDGLESVANYATAMIAIVFYLPAILLWTGTIAVSLLIGWRTLRWAGRRWFGWTSTALHV
jgi:hypothetical protein